MMKNHHHDRKSTAMRRAHQILQGRGSGFVAGFVLTALASFLNGPAALSVRGACSLPVYLSSEEPHTLDFTCFTCPKNPELKVVIDTLVSHSVTEVTWTVESSDEPNSSAASRGVDVVADPAYNNLVAHLVVPRDTCVADTYTVAVRVGISCDAGGSMVFEDDVEYEVTCPDSGCASCGNDGNGPPNPPMGTAGFGNNNGPNITFSGGPHDEKNRFSAMLKIRSETPSTDLAQPSSMQVIYKRSAGVTRYPVTGTFEQVKVPMGLLRVANLDTTNKKYDLEVYHDDDVYDNGTKWVPNDAQTIPFVTFKISSPGQDANKLRIGEYRPGDAQTALRQFDYEYDTQNSRWSLTENQGDRELLAWKTTGGGETTYHTELQQNSTTVAKEESTYETVNNQTVLTLVTQGTGTETNQVDYIYYTSGNGIGQVNRINYADGRWEKYVYDSEGRVSKHYVGNGDGAPPANDSTEPTASTAWVTEYSYTAVDTNDNDAIRTTLARRETVKVPVSGTWYIMSDTLRSTGDSLWQVEEQVCTELAWGNAGGWGDSGNLITVTTYYDSSSGAKEGRIKSIIHPNGTATFYDYGSDANGSWTTVDNGEPNTSTPPTGIANGTQTKTEYNNLGQISKATVKEIVSGTTDDTLEELTYTYTDGSGNLLDTSGRSCDVEDVAGRVTKYRYSCCGLSTVEDLDGVQTSYDYDEWGRQTEETRLSITHENVLDAAGRVRGRRRIGTDDSTILLAGTKYDTAGRMTASTNAFLALTTYAESMVNNKRQVLTTYPDTSTMTEYYYRDGRLEKRTGGATHPVRFEYGAEELLLDSTYYYREYAKEIKLDSSGNDTDEWVTTYYDGGGRPYLTVYADNDANPADNPFSRSYYNDEGQLEKQVDPDGVITLYAYNNLGEREQTVVDVDQDSSIDYSGKDRITKVERDVTTYTDDSTTYDVLRTRTSVYDTDNNSTPTLVSSSLRCTDGLKIWQIQWDDTTEIVTKTETTYQTGGQHTETVTHPDDSQLVRVYQNGRLSTVSRKNSSGGTVTQVTYAYDEHGRVETVTDLRNGATSYTYNDADQVETTTTPAPGDGSPPQVTALFYDQYGMGRQTGSLLPDGTTVTNFYNDLGLLSSTSGSRMYPVAYVYDAQGRMTEMSTWGPLETTTRRPPPSGITTNTAAGWLRKPTRARPLTTPPARTTTSIVMAAASRSGVGNGARPPSRRPTSTASTTRRTTMTSTGISSTWTTRTPRRTSPGPTTAGVGSSRWCATA